jgi:hypothetical protein
VVIVKVARNDTVVYTNAHTTCDTLPQQVHAFSGLQTTTILLHSDFSILYSRALGLFVRMEINNMSL